jgi:hypothetical protein
MVVISFTRKRNLKGLKGTVLLNRTIQLTSEVEHLGLKLCKGLAWKIQLVKVIKKAYKSFRRWTSRLDKAWGM